MNTFFLKNKKNNFKKRGFTILFAVIVSSLVLAIGISIGSITLKQIKISILGRDSQVAFYSADSGSECVMYHDLINKYFATSSDSATAIPAPALEISCFDQLFPITSVETDSESATTTIIMKDEATSPNICAKVTISKYDSDNDGYSDRTIILSRGNNYCDANTNRLLERGIRIKY